jgi:hypothetical protein
MRKHILSLAAALLMTGGIAQAQKVWTEPAQYTNPAETLKIYVNLALMDCQSLVGTAGPLYLWSWMPGEPVNGNGQWNASNTANAWVNEGPDIWSFTMVPTDFYGVPAQDIYDSDIFFLVKALDGGGGGDCSATGTEFKTEDLTLEINPPGPVFQKVASFPAKADGDSLWVTQDDIFTLLYDNGFEEKVPMQNATDLYVYARAYDTDGIEYRPSPISTVGSNPNLRMVKDGTKFSWSIWPDKLFNLPAGKTLDYVRLQIMKPVLNNSDDAVDGTFVYYFRCN